MRQRLFIILFGCLTMASVRAQQVLPLPKMPAQPLRSDLALLQQILEANHPSLYWYTPKDSMDYYFREAINSITDSLNELQYKNKLARLVARIHCGHTAVRFSKNYGRIANRYRYPQFPLALKAWDDSLVVLASVYPNDRIFKRGTIVTAINGLAPQQLFDSIFPYISTDGYADNYKSQLISGNFPGWYKTIFGDADSVYRITYLDSTGHEQSTAIHAYNPAKDSTHQKIERDNRREQPSRRTLRKLRLLNKRSLYIDTAANTAFMRVTSFTGGRLKTFFRRSFRELKKLGITNLVLDLRENGGGNVGNSIRLTEYLTDTAFRIGDTVAAINRSFPYGRYIKPKFFFRMAMFFGSRKMDDGRFHYRRYEQHYYQPSSNNHFTGKIYLLQGGYSFSAATMLIAQLKGQSHVTVVGEETGGSYYGNSAMHIPTITLPNTGIQVTLPMYRLVMDRTRDKGHGIIPDLWVKPSSYAIQQGIDLKVQRVRELIAAGNTSTDNNRH
jgi:hypothetical protein